MEKTKFLKKSASFDSAKNLKGTLTSGGGGSVKPAKRRPLIGANPPQKLSAEVKQKLDEMVRNDKILERVAAYTSSCKVKKKKNEL